MAITLGTASTNTGSATSTLTRATYTPDAGTGRVLLVFVGFQDPDADNTVISSVSSSAGGTFTEYGQVTEESGATDDVVAGIFYSTDFVDGSQTITATLSGSVTRGGIAVVTALGCNTASPWRAAATKSSTTNIVQNETMNVSSATNDLVVDVVTARSMGAGVNPTVGANQTQVFNVQVGTDNLDFAGSSEPGGTTITMSWTGGAGSIQWAHVAGSLVPASTGIAKLLSGKLRGLLRRD